MFCPNLLHKNGVMKFVYKSQVNARGYNTRSLVLLNGLGLP